MNTADVETNTKKSTKDLLEQIKILKKHLPNTGDVDKNYLDGIENGSISLPLGADGWVVIPKWSTITNSELKAFELLVMILTTALSGKFYDKLERHFAIDPCGSASVFVQSKSKTRISMDLIEGLQSNGTGLLIIPVQFGGLHLGCSPQKVESSLTTLEFGLTIWDIGIMLLTHPENFLDGNHAVSLGNKPITADSDWSDPAYIYLHSTVESGEMELHLSKHWRSISSPTHGVPTGFLPQ